MEDVSTSDRERAGQERRAVTWRTVVYGYVRSRRRGARRDEEGEHLLSDWRPRWLFIIAIGIIFLSALDAFLSLKLVSLGAEEINPVMAYLLDKSDALFVAGKIMLTALGVLMLVFVSRTRLFQRIRIDWMLTIFFGLYAGLVCFEFIHVIRAM